MYKQNNSSARGTGEHAGEISSRKDLFGRSWTSICCQIKIIQLSQIYDLVQPGANFLISHWLQPGQ